MKLCFLRLFIVFSISTAGCSQKQPFSGRWQEARKTGNASNEKMPFNTITVKDNGHFECTRYEGKGRNFDKVVTYRQTGTWKIKNATDSSVDMEITVTEVDADTGEKRWEGKAESRNAEWKREKDGTETLYYSYTGKCMRVGSTSSTSRPSTGTSSTTVSASDVIGRWVGEYQGLTAMDITLFQNGTYVSSSGDFAGGKVSQGTWRLSGNRVTVQLSDGAPLSFTYSGGRLIAGNGQSLNRR